MENYEKKYKEALEWMRDLYPSLEGSIKEDAEHFFPELKESKDERIKRAIKHILYENNTDAAIVEGVEIAEIAAWLEKQGEIDLDYKDGENEKRKFVGYGFLKCKGDFLSFKEGETYWLEYVGKDNYNVRSDNLLGQTFHIKPVELYTVFRPTTWLEKQGKVPVTIDIDKMVRDYANNKERGNEEFGKPVNCMIRAYRQGLTDAISTLMLKSKVKKPTADAKQLNPDDVIAWLQSFGCDVDNLVETFKKHFEI